MDWSRIELELSSEHVVEGHIEGRKEITVRRGRNGKQLINDIRKRDDSGN